MIDAILQPFQKAVEIFPVKKNPLTFNPLTIQLTGAFGQRNVVVSSPSRSYVDKVGSSVTCTYLPGKDTVISVVSFHFARFLIVSICGSELEDKNRE